MFSIHERALQHVLQMWRRDAWGGQKKQHVFKNTVEDKSVKYIMLFNSKTKASCFYFFRNMNKCKDAETSQYINTNTDYATIIKEDDTYLKYCLFCLAGHRNYLDTYI